jgi:beta-glucosidase
LPPIEDYAMSGRTYRYFSGQPVYPFGYGLSYTKFAYGPVKVSSRASGNGYAVEADVTNTGARAGDEVVQLYLDFPKAPGVPKIALRGFQRVSLAPGETRTVRLELSPRDISSVSPQGATRVLAGRYGVYVGGGQPGTGAPGSSGAFNVRTAMKLPE